MTNGSHPRHLLDPVLLSPIRLSVMTALSEVAEAEMKVVADLVEVSLSTMSNQMTALTQAGYLTVRKGYVGRRPRTWIGLTPEGRRRLDVHLRALRAIATEPVINDG